MDLNTARAILTAIAFVTFLGIVWWAYHQKSKASFDDAAQLPFQDNAMDSDSAQHRAGQRPGQQTTPR